MNKLLRHWNVWIIFLANYNVMNELYLYECRAKGMDILTKTLKTNIKGCLCILSNYQTSFCVYIPWYKRNSTLEQK